MPDIAAPTDTAFLNYVTVTVPTVALLRTEPLPPSGVTKIVFLIGKNTMGDNLGGFYRWDMTSTDTEDTQFMNVIASDLNTTGRWLRVFQRARNTAGGATLVNNGGVRTMFISATTNSSGEISINMTEEGTSGGTAIFTEIWSITATANINATGPADAVQSYRKTLAANLKTATYGFYKANAVTITLGLLLVPVASIGSGTSILVRVEGV